MSHLMLSQRSPGNSDMERERPKTSLGSFGDPMCEFNIQRRLQWWRECNPSGIIKVSQESVDADPALQRAVLELPFVQVRKPRK